MGEPEWKVMGCCVLFKTVAVSYLAVLRVYLDCEERSEIALSSMIVLISDARV